MHVVAVTNTTAEYDLLDEHLSTPLIEGYFGKPLATWDPAALEPGEQETVARAFVRSAETKRIEIDRENHVVWITYSVAVEIDYNANALEYFGATLDSIVGHGCHVTFPLDERKVEFVDDESSTRAT